MMIVRFALVAMSFAPPEPGSMVLRPPVSRSRIIVEFTLPYRSTCAPPITPRSRRPFCMSFMITCEPGSATARSLTVVSVTLNIRRRGLGFTVPHSVVTTMFLAWVIPARLAASVGMPTPAIRVS